jgi:hypothetical protein
VVVRTVLTKPVRESRFRTSTRTCSPYGRGADSPHCSTTTLVERSSLGSVATPHSHMHHDQSSASEVKIKTTTSDAPSARFSETARLSPAVGRRKSVCDEQWIVAAPALRSSRNVATTSAIALSGCRWRGLPGATFDGTEVLPTAIPPIRATGPVGNTSSWECGLNRRASDPIQDVIDLQSPPACH